MDDMFLGLDLGSSEQGQVYVPVMADDAMSVSLMSAAGSEGAGQTDKGFVIYWKSNGGITGTKGWELNGKHVQYVPGNIEQTNQNLGNAVVNKADAKWVTNNLGDCWDYL